MKLWQKIFLSSLSLIIVAVNVIFVMLVNSSHKILIEKEQNHAINEYEYFSASLANTLIYERLKLGKVMLNIDETSALISEVTASGSTGYSSSAVYDSDMQLVGSYNIYTMYDFDQYEDYPLKIKVPENNYNVKIMTSGEKYMLTICSDLIIEGRKYRIVTGTDISDIFRPMEKENKTIQQISIAASLGISLILLISVIVLLRPLSRINMYTKAIASGKYNIRVKCRGSVEFRELADNMNKMADSIENNASRLEKIAEDRQTFIANLAHEMKTPLTSILGFGDLLKIKKNVSEKERAEYAGIIVEETKRLRSLSGKLMELITIGSTEIEKNPVSIEKMISDTAAALEPILNKNSVTLICRTVPVSINADEELFKSLLYNLIENAVKASAICQEIILTSEIKDENVLITIKDSGIGMTKEDAERVFEPFYMVDKSRSRKAGGAGLGLALCVKIADMHNAKLNIQSELGKGTTVCITISGEECV